jgi:hypothetical protein
LNGFPASSRLPLEPDFFAKQFTGRKTVSATNAVSYNHLGPDISVSPEVKSSADEAGLVLLHLGLNVLFRTNRIGAEIWSALAKNIPMAAIAEQLTAQYGVSRPVIEDHVTTFVDELVRLRLVNVRSTASKAALVTQAFWELLRYEIVVAARGLLGVCEGLRAMRVTHGRNLAGPEEICDAVERALVWYFKPVQCVQRSIVTARLLRRHGFQAHVAIGFRSTPFFGHAWVELDGRVINDANEYRRRLNVIERI